ncbi:ring-cleaving dioxygenase [Opitutus sp. GAS368]|jgi:glyoxalase family protein|uniref:ring-cleaving dioxygenase n=1 Tax=Opitutus sp. GAS368 TaxID=1882749 RepID=UPI00087C96DD|nr:ring-cleaving dioxygenase [Opitutus sp. GAS368]SDR69372.1 glyoxalase family protein [Opitutus sp. GAS368]
MNAQVTGLHHITAIASDPRQNLDFYTRALGLRFVKKSVNQDDPGTYHLYYGDYAASPGTILTFFPWAGLRRGRPGTGQAYATAFSVPAGSLPFWQERFEKLGVKYQAVEKRFADEVLPLTDPDGLRLELVATSEADARPATPAKDVPAEFAIRGFHGSTLALADAAATEQVLTGSMGYKLAGQSGHRARYSAGRGGPGTYVDLLTDPALPRGLNGAGTIHHVAFRVPDSATEVAARDILLKDGLHVSPVIDRAYFKSIYYREPAGVLFEIATDGPGFAIDEPLDQLGTTLGLPPHLEPHRAEIEAALPKLN